MPRFPAPVSLRLRTAGLWCAQLCLLGLALPARPGQAAPQTGTMPGALPHTTISGKVETREGWTTTPDKGLVELPLQGQPSAITVKGRAGADRSGLRLAFLDETGKQARAISVVAIGLRIYGAETLPDAQLFLPGQLRYSVRPNLTLYDAQQRTKLLPAWETLPPASTHNFELKLVRKDPGITQVWMDGQFLGVLPQVHMPAKISAMRVYLAPGSGLGPVEAVAAADSEHLGLPVARFPRPGALQNPQISLAPDAGLPEAMDVSAGVANGIAVHGLSVIPGLGADDLQSFFWRRGAADNLPEQRLFAVPQDFYSHAQVLCAAEEAPGKVPAFTLRLTRYTRSRGNAMADTLVRVPSGQSAEGGARKVGTLTYGPADARIVRPLWLLKVPLRNGLIQDLLYDEPRRLPAGTQMDLDVELMDPLQNAESPLQFPPTLAPTERAYTPTSHLFSGYDYYASVAEPQHSSVHVFGLSLQRAAAAMEVRSSPRHQVFYATDKASFVAEVSARVAGQYSLSWDIADLEGKTVSRGTRSLTLGAGAVEKLDVPLDATTGTGWFAARFRLADARGEELVDYRTTYVLLPPDTRKAGLESPFYGGWFGKNHGSDIQLDELGPFMQRAGIRNVGLHESMPEKDTLPKYGFTESTVSWTAAGSGRQGLLEYSNGTKTLQEAIAMQEAYIAKHLELWPSTDHMLVFHESGGGASFPSELWGQPAPPLTAEQEKTWKFRTQYLTAMAKMVRARFPKLKMQYGNDGNSMALIGELLRRKFPRDYIDSIASEDLGQTQAPERTGLGSTQDGWFLRELARKMGYGDVPVTATTEWIGRMTERLGLQTQAEWKVRDGLLALGYNYRTISIAGLNDAGDGYYYSIWGNGGITERYPIMAPKPAYAAVATLTRVLDQASFQRFVPVDSPVLYVQEFRKGNQWVYAAWMPRGTRPVTLEFAPGSSLVQTDLYGREKAVGPGQVTLQVGTAVTYLTAFSRLAKLTPGVATYPQDKIQVPDKPLQMVNLDSLETVTVVSDKTREKNNINLDLGKITEGEYHLRVVQDEEMGQCLEIEPKTDRVPPLDTTEYIYLAFKKPIVTPARNAGIWIKGNGSWGAVNIVKNKWGPWADNGNLHRRWPGDATMNFEGWNFIQYPYYDWLRSSAPGSSTTLRGLHITLPRQTLSGNEMVPVRNQKVRIKSMLLY